MANLFWKTNWRPSGNLNGSTKSEARECPSCHGSRLNAVARHVRVQRLYDR